jgi:hypothetical protein
MTDRAARKRAIARLVDVAEAAYLRASAVGYDEGAVAELLQVAANALAAVLEATAPPEPAAEEPTP